MSPKGSNVALALVVILTISHGAWAQSVCTNALMSLSPCLNFVTGNSTMPSSSCCSSLVEVVNTQPQCLCTMINGGGAMAGLAVNQTLAMALPGACNVQTPSASKCNTAVSPASAPVQSPSSDSTPTDSSSNDKPDTTTATTPSQTSTPSSTGSGSKTVPSTTGASSNAIAIKLHLPVAMLLIFIVSAGTTRF